MKLKTSPTKVLPECTAMTSHHSPPPKLEIFAICVISLKYIRVPCKADLVVVALQLHNKLNPLSKHPNPELFGKIWNFFASCVSDFSFFAQVKPQTKGAQTLFSYRRSLGPFLA